MNKKSLTSLQTMLKIGLLCVGVLVALALTAPGPPLSDAANKEEQAASDAARQQLEQLKLSLASEHSQGALPPIGEAGDSATGEFAAAPEALNPAQEEELARIRNRLMLANEPLNLVEEPADDTLDDLTLQALADIGIQVQEAEEQSNMVEPFISQELEDKKALLAAEEARLSLERQSMEELRDDIDRRLAELREVQKAVEAITAMEQKSDLARESTEMSLEERHARVVQVSKIIAQMRPAPAAEVIGHLRNDLAVEIMSRIPARTAGRIMAALLPEKAAAISVVMASQDKVMAAQYTQRNAEEQLNEARQAASQAAEQAAGSTQAQNPGAGSAQN